MRVLRITDKSSGQTIVEMSINERQFSDMMSQRGDIHAKILLNDSGKVGKYQRVHRVLMPACADMYAGEAFSEWKSAVSEAWEPHGFSVDRESRHNGHRASRENGERFYQVILRKYEDEPGTMRHDGYPHGGYEWPAPTLSAEELEAFKARIGVD